jgi:hypothetical protein
MSLEMKRLQGSTLVHWMSAIAYMSLYTIDRLMNCSGYVSRSLFCSFSALLVYFNPFPYFQLCLRCPPAAPHLLHLDVPPPPDSFAKILRLGDSSAAGSLLSRS